jgi:DNA-binding NarL/FixJ family response regulator
MRSDKCSVLIVDDHPVIRHGIRMLLEQEVKSVVFGEAGNLDAATLVIREDHPDLIILDLISPGNDGLSAIPAIRKLSPKSEIVVFSMLSGPEMVRLSLEAGARAFVSKIDHPKQLVLAVRNALSGKPFIGSHSLRTVALLGPGGNQSQLRKTTPSKRKISKREAEIAKLISEGKSNKQIAGIVNLSARTVESYRAKLMRKMGFSNVSELIRFAIRDEGSHSGMLFP